MTLLYPVASPALHNGSYSKPVWHHSVFKAALTVINRYVHKWRNSIKFVLWWIWLYSSCCSQNPHALSHFSRNCPLVLHMDQCVFPRFVEEIVSSKKQPMIKERFTSRWAHKKLLSHHRATRRPTTLIHHTSHPVLITTNSSEKYPKQNFQNKNKWMQRFF